MCVSETTKFLPVATYQVGIFKNMKIRLVIISVPVIFLFSNQKKCSTYTVFLRHPSAWLNFLISTVQRNNGNQ